jgi:acetolactate synthase-1/2/3 large subunit
MDGSRVLFVTGNVSTAIQGINAFQDGGDLGCRDVALFASAVRYTAAVNTAEELVQALDFSWQAMHHPCAGPAHLSIARDVFESAMAFSGDGLETSPAHSIASADLSLLLDALKGTERILLLVGQRLIDPHTSELLRSFAEKYQMPVVTTLAAKGIWPESHPLSFGNAGFGGQDRANALLLNPELELLLLLGADLNEKDSMGWNPGIAPPNRTLVRIDAVATPVRHPLQPDIEIIGDSLAALRYLVDTSLDVLKQTAKARQYWIEESQKSETLTQQTGAPQTVILEQLVTTLQRHAAKNAILVVDAGSHRPIAARFWMAEPGTFFNPSATAPMGWGISAAIGVQLAEPKSRVISLTGDGCMRMHGIELATAARYALPVLFVVCNNSAYATLDKHATASVGALINLPDLDWTAFAKTLGVPGKRVNRPQDLACAIQWALAKTDGPCLLEVMTSSP